jgi:hypothetical protein|tara:strand:- start:933 stop:1076 length:144 start_codon:yes stop_codon:yes gene_type:complete
MTDDHQELDFNDSTWFAPEEDTHAYFDNDEQVSDTKWFDQVFIFDAD